MRKQIAKIDPFREEMINPICYIHIEMSKASYLNEAIHRHVLRVNDVSLPQSHKCYAQCFSVVYAKKGEAQMEISADYGNTQTNSGTMSPIY